MAHPERLTEGTTSSSLRQRNTCSLAALISICVYALSGPLLILINKTIIKQHGLHAPALVGCMGIMFTALVSHIIASLGLVSISPIRDPKSAALPIMLVGACTSFSFLLGNKAYVYCDAGFLQMMKAATPALLMIALVIFRIERISLGVGLCSLAMVGGSIMAAIHAPHLNAPGILIQLGSQGCEVMQNVLIQFFLQHLSFTAIDAGYYIAPMSTLCSLFLSLALESEIITRDGGELVLQEIPWLCASGLVGVAVNFSNFFVIQYISSLMAKLIGVARSAGLVTVLVLFFNEELTLMQVIGYAITLVAFGGYSGLKAKESRDLTQSPEGKDDVELSRLALPQDDSDPLLGEVDP